MHARACARVCVCVCVFVWLALVAVQALHYMAPSLIFKSVTTSKHGLSLKNNSTTTRPQLGHCLVTLCYHFILLVPLLCHYSATVSPRLCHSSATTLPLLEHYHCFVTALSSLCNRTITTLLCLIIAVIDCTSRSHPRFVALAAECSPANCIFHALPHCTWNITQRNGNPSNVPNMHFAGHLYPTLRWELPRPTLLLHLFDRSSFAMG